MARVARAGDPFHGVGGNWYTSNPAGGLYDTGFPVKANGRTVARNQDPVPAHVHWIWTGKSYTAFWFGLGTSNPAFISPPVSTHTFAGGWGVARPGDHISCGCIIDDGSTNVLTT